MPKEWYDLKNWFETEYTQKEQKYRRLIALGIMCDDGSFPQMRLEELYVEAEVKRKRIQEIESMDILF